MHSFYDGNITAHDVTPPSGCVREASRLNEHTRGGVKVIASMGCLFLIGCSDAKLPAFAQGPSCDEVGTLSIQEGQMDPTDGCTVVNVPVSMWKPVFAGFRYDVSDFDNPSQDNPLYQVTDLESTDRVCVNVELRPYGGAWNGATGIYNLDCNNGVGGLCVYLYPDGHAYVVDAGKIDIQQLPPKENPMGPFTLVLSDMTFRAFGETSQACYHVDTVTLTGTMEDLSPTL